MPILSRAQKGPFEQVQIGKRGFELAGRFCNFLLRLRYSPAALSGLFKICARFEARIKSAAKSIYIRTAQYFA